MITLRSSKARSEVALICLEVTLTTPRSVYTIFSEGPMTDLGSSFDGARFGAISWPISCFRLADGVLIEQQMFLPHDGSAVALSWDAPGQHRYCRAACGATLLLRTDGRLLNSKFEAANEVACSFVSKNARLVCPPRGS